jgi:hypothetical protein
VAAGTAAVANSAATNTRRKVRLLLKSAKKPSIRADIVIFFPGLAVPLMA